MPSIGSLYFEIRGQTTRLVSDAEKGGQAAGAKASKGFSSKFAGGLKSFGGGLAAGLGLGVFQSATALVGKFVDVLGDAVQAARDDQQSQQALRTSLEANVPAWDGNTDAIEKLLQARIDLGYSDDEQRQSLATLVTATHDVASALDLERGAMDISRKRKVDLATVTDALAKAYAGNTKSLKTLIPGLKLGATTAETIANAFAAAGNAAEDFADTEEGKLLVTQKKMNERLEALGYKVLPLVSNGIKALDDLFGAIDGSYRDQVQALESDTAALEKNGGTLEDVVALRERWAALKERAKSDFTTVSELDSLGRVNDHLSVLGVELAKSGDAARHWQHEVAQLDTKPIDDMTDATHGFEKASQTASRAVVRSWSQVVTDLGIVAQSAIDDFFDPIEARYAALVAHRATVEAAAAAKDAKTATERHDAAATVISALDDQATALKDLGAQHALTRTDVDNYKKDVAAAYKALGQKVPAAMQPIFDSLYALSAFKGVDIKVAVKTVGGVVQDFSTQHGGPKASGGPVQAGVIYPVNEKPGQQEFYAPANGRIYPTVAAGLSATGLGGEKTDIHLTVPAAPTALKPADIVRELRIRARDGSLRRR